jgi:hypothetical protein
MERAAACGRAISVARNHAQGAYCSYGAAMRPLTTRPTPSRLGGRQEGPRLKRRCSWVPHFCGEQDRRGRVCAQSRRQVDSGAISVPATVASAAAGQRGAVGRSSARHRAASKRTQSSHRPTIFTACSTRSVIGLE